MSEVLEKQVETEVEETSHDIEGLELSMDIEGEDVVYTGTMEYTRQFAFEARFRVGEAYDKKQVRQIVIKGAVYTDDGSAVNGYVAMHAPFKKLILLILTDLAEINSNAEDEVGVEAH